MSYMPGEIRNPTFGNDLGVQWAEILSNPYHISNLPSRAEAVHYQMVADSMRMTFDPAETAKVKSEYIRAGRGDELGFISLIVEVDTIAIAGQVCEELKPLVTEPQAEPPVELDEAAVEAAVLSGLKVAYFLTKGGFAK